MATVRDRVLLGIAELGHRAAGSLVGDEDRVVAEAPATARRGRQRARAAALEERLGPLGGDVGDDAHVARAAARRGLAVELGQVLGVRRILAREAGRPD